MGFATNARAQFTSLTAWLEVRNLLLQSGQVLANPLQVEAEAAPDHTNVSADVRSVLLRIFEVQHTTAHRLDGLRRAELDRSSVLCECLWEQLCYTLLLLSWLTHTLPNSSAPSMVLTTTNIL